MLRDYFRFRLAAHSHTGELQRYEDFIHPPPFLYKNKMNPLRINFTYGKPHFFNIIVDEVV